MTRAVSVLEVADAGVWAELDAVVPLAPHVEAEETPLRRVMRPSSSSAPGPKRKAGS